MQELTVRQARDRYFQESGLPLDGGYDLRWVPVKWGFLTLYLYNGAARRRVVQLHDIHHVVTGYSSDFRGEAAISAWELAAGVSNKHTARILDLAGLSYGGYLFPKTTFQAYVLGTQSKTLYSEGFSQSLLEESVETLRKRLLPAVPREAKAMDYFRYALLVGLASLPGLVLMIGCLAAFVALAL